MTKGDKYTKQKNATTYIKVCDVAQNCSQISTSKIKIDTTAPKCATTKKSGTSGVTATFKCTDSGGSGLKSSCETKKTGVKSSQTYKTIYDNAGNSATCKVSVSKKCTAYKCTSHYGWVLTKPGDGNKCYVFDRSIGLIKWGYYICIMSGNNCKNGKYGPKAEKGLYDFDIYQNCKKYIVI